jgi:hypothetical protein
MGKKISDPDIRAMFTREALIKSKWYRARLVKKQTHDVGLWKQHVTYLETFLNRPSYEVEALRLHISKRLEDARRELAHVSSPEYIEKLVGTLGADPLHDGYVMVERNGTPPTDVE